MDSRFNHSRVYICFCRICGKRVKSNSSRRRYCDNPKCILAKLLRKNERRKERRRRLSALGIPVHTDGNK